MKFEVGKKLEPFCCDTICQDGVSAEDLTEGLPTMFLFLRYYGCRICQLDLRDLDLGYEAVRRAGGRVVAVLQSKRERLEAAAEEKPFPYTGICDPDQKLYKMCIRDSLKIDVSAVGGGEKVAFCDCHVCDPFLGRITVLLLYKNWVINQIYRFYEKYNKKVIEEEGMWAKICDYR